MLKWFRNIVILLVFASASHLFSQADEYSVKAYALEKFTRFIEWPGSNYFDNKERFVIGIIGKNPFGNKLKIIYSEQKIKNKPVHIKYFYEISDIDGCNLLFISGSEKSRLNDILKYIAGKPILSISDNEGFAEKGVHINTSISGQQLRFEINVSAMKESGLSVGYQLLKLAKIVRTEGGH